MLMHHDHVPVPVCTISILWNFHADPYHPSEQRVETPSDGAGEHLKNDKLRVAGHGPGNTRARRTNTVKRAPNMLMHHGHVCIPVCTISILWNSHTNPCHPSENYELQPEGHRRRTTTRTQITSCTARAGQHARPLHKHCKPCANHAHAP
jgi:hypothetical protein